jgi:phospholipid/cholesterol/gamma-HCH transport system substrate-binding protein
MRDRWIELRVGIAVVLAMIILVWGIIWVKEYRFRQERYTLSVLFPNVGALDVGDPVAVLGVKKGEVEQIKLYKGDVLVTMNLTTDVKLKEDAEFTVMNIGLMGERFISVQPGHGEKSLDLSQPARGFYDTGIPEVMGMMGQMIAEIRTLTGYLKGALGTEWSEEKIKETIKNVNQLSSDLASLLKENKPKIDKSINDLSYASSELKEMVNQNKPKLDTTLDKFSHASNDLEKITSTLEDLSSSLKKLSQKIEKGEGTLGQLINDQTLYQDLKKTTRSIDELVEDIRKNPRKYFKLELF